MGQASATHGSGNSGYACIAEFGYLKFSDRELKTECVAEDLDEIAGGGALRVAAETLYGDARNDGASALDRRIADAALSRLYSFVQGQAQ